MKLQKNIFLMIGLLFITIYSKDQDQTKCTNNEKFMQKNHDIRKQDFKVEKKVLENGMTVLVFEVHSIPKVSLQIWYNVGSKDEKTGEKGIAHLIEHMIFKGTSGKQSLNLSESDINTITHVLSGSCNAFTTQDFTGYLFDMPTQHWKEALPIMADCMMNASFKDEHLNSEMKAVIQELKMRRDRYALTLGEELMSTIFSDHPYHYPIIGYKQDLWSVHGKDLLRFYKKHYHPNNATLIVVGDVKADEVFSLAKKYFAPIKPDLNYTKHVFYHNKDLASKSVTLYRDVNQPVVMVAYLVPGLTAKKKQLLDVLSLIIGSGRGSRLYKKIVDELHLATSLSTSYWDFLFDYSLFYIAFEPKHLDDVDAIIAIINQEIDSIINEGLQDFELERAIKKAQMHYYSTLEDMHQLAFDIGKYYLATGDENYIFTYLHEPKEQLHSEIVQLLDDYFRPSLMHTGKVVGLASQDKALWQTLQQQSDQEDADILSARIRQTPVESPSYAKQLKIKPAKQFNFPKAEQCVLSNGLKVLYHNNPVTPKINLELRFKALSYYDPQEKQGLYRFMTTMLDEGTECYTAAELAHELESRGISFEASPGFISMTMLTEDLHKGLELLLEILTKATFDEQEIEKVRVQLFADLKNFWDNPASFSGQLIKEQVYKNHPYSKITIGTEDVIRSITRDDLIDLYKRFITPQDATLAIVGDLTSHDVCKELETILGNWKGPKVTPMQFPVITQPVSKTINYPINRDQVTLSFAGLSITRKDPDYDKLLLFDQILGGGVLGSMKSRLFKLREQTGLFYSIAGSLISQANEQPGMIMIKTLVSLDRLAEAEKAIKETLLHVADTITPTELTEAKNAIINSLALNFESNAGTASAFLFLDKYDFPADYFDNRAAALAAITAPQIQAAVKRVLHPDKLLVYKIGRVEK